MHTVIIGSGVAGWTLVRELRKLTPDSDTHPITLICSDSGDFYSKPMLSNAVTAKKTPAQLLMTAAAKLAEQQKVTLLNNTQVSAIDTAKRSITHHQQTTAYDQLVLALGADPIRLPLEGNGTADVMSVNDLADYGLFREKVDATHGGQARIAILGAGLIGCEFANDLLAAGHQVTVYDIAPLPLGRLLPIEAGEYLKQALSTAGVQWELGNSAIRIEKNNHSFELTDQQGNTREYDHVLSAVGLRPRTQIAQQAGLTTKRGIQVNKLGQTSDPAIYALGDCAEYGDGLVLPYIMPVMQAARAMAATLAGNPTDIKFPAMPVMVKTPACATVVSPPANSDEGSWVIEPIDNGLRALFKSADGSLKGMALLGEAVKERQTLSTQLPAVWA